MQTVSALSHIRTVVKAKLYHWRRSLSNNQRSIPLTTNVTRTRFQNPHPSLFLDYPTRLLANPHCKSSYCPMASKPVNYLRYHPYMAGTNSIFQSHLSPSYLANMRQLLSLFFKSSASRYGAWTNTGTTVSLRYSCLSYSSALSCGR
jgi:hypothetical protein